MLDFAINHSEQLKLVHRTFITKNLDHCKYYIYDNWISYDLEIENSNWNKLQLVSLNSNNEITGLITASYNRSVNNISNFSLISYQLTSNPILYRDVIKFIDEQFKLGIININFSSVAGSPASHINSRLVQKYNGNKVGIYINNVKLIDGRLYNTNSFQIHNPYSNAI